MCRVSEYYVKSANKNAYNIYMINRIWNTLETQAKYRNLS